MLVATSGWRTSPESGNQPRGHPRCSGVQSHIAQVLDFMRQGTPPPGAQFSQLRFASPYLPHEPPQLHPLLAYSSGALKM